MANFYGHQMTTAGQNLSAYLIANALPLNYSSVKIGDGLLGSQIIADLTALISQKLSLPIARTPTRSGDGRWNVTAVMTNEEVTVAFQFREWGVFALDPRTSQEVLVQYANAGATADYIPAWDGSETSTYIEKTLTCACVATSEVAVTAVVDHTQEYVPQEEFDAHASRHAAGGEDPLTAADVGAVPAAGGTMTGKLNLPAGTTAGASINVPTGVAPTAPTAGDVWADDSGRLWIRRSGINVQLHDTGSLYTPAQAEAEAGTSTAQRAWTAQRVAQAIAAQAAKPPVVYTATLLASGWSASAPYTQTVSVAGVLETDLPDVGPVYSATLTTRQAQREAWNLVGDAESAAGSLTFTCDEDKPETDIPIQIRVVR